MLRLPPRRYNLQMCTVITISDSIKKYRTSANITQKEFGDMIGVTAQAISKWEREKGYPDITILPRIARVLGCSVSDFFNSGDLST